MEIHIFEQIKLIPHVMRIKRGPKVKITLRDYGAIFPVFLKCVTNPITLIHSLTSAISKTFRCKVVPYGLNDSIMMGEYKSVKEMRNSGCTFSTQHSQCKKGKKY